MKRTSVFGLSVRAGLRFRRWSRKRYAAFVSLHRTVTMGRLAVHIADRLQKKQQSLSPAACVVAKSGDSEDWDKERMEREPEGMNLFLLFLELFITIQVGKAAAQVAASFAGYISCQKDKLLFQYRGTEIQGLLDASITRISVPLFFM